jgi:hypothetical protein
MGQLLAPGDVPAFLSGKAVKHDYQLDEKNVPDTTGGDSSACCSAEGGVGVVAALLSAAE